MSSDSDTTFSPTGLIAGLIFPGAGHMATGRVARGALVSAGVLGLFLGGILIGGIDVIDSQEDRVWFIGESLVGPLAFGIDAIHQSRFKAYDLGVMGIIDLAQLDQLQKRSGYPTEVRVPHRIEHLLDKDASRASGRDVRVSRDVWVWEPAGPGQGPPNKKSLAKVNELGTLFATIAGMMNLIALIDAAFPTTRRGRMALATASATGSASANFAQSGGSAGAGAGSGVRS